MLKKLLGLRKPKWQTVQSGNVPKWVQKQIDRIYRSGTAGDPGEIVVYQLRGRRFRYKLEFPVGVGENGYRAYGNVRVYSKPRMWYWKKLHS